MVDDLGQGPSGAQFRQRLAAGDHAAFEELIDRYRLPLLRFVAKRTPSLDSHEVDDIVQETFVRFWQYRGRLRSSGNLRSLLWAYSSNVSGEYLRRKQIRLHSPLQPDIPCPGPSAEDEARGRELKETLEKALAQLTEAQRTSLEFRSQNLSAKEIAGRTGCTPKAADRSCEQARQHLRQSLISDYTD